MPRIGSQAIERAYLLLPVEIGGRGNAVHVDILLWAGVYKSNDAVRVFKRRRMEQKGFGHAEHGGVQPDAYGERQDGNHRGEPMLP